MLTLLRVLITYYLGWLCVVAQRTGERGKSTSLSLWSKGIAPRSPKPGNRGTERFFQAMTTYDMKQDIQKEMVRLRQIATSEMKWSEAPQNQYLKSLWKGLRQADQTILRRAYQLLIREEQRRIRNERAHYEIRDFLQRMGEAMPDHREEDKS